MPFSPPQLEVTATGAGWGDLVCVSGTLDFSTVAALRAALVEPQRRLDRRVVLDLDGVEFLDAQGIAMLVTARQLVVGRGGELVLACSRPHLRTLLRISRLDSVVRVVDSADGLAAGGSLAPS